MGYRDLTNPFLIRGKRDKTQSKAYRKSRKTEKRIASRFGGFTVSGSGSGRRKGDVDIRDLFRIEVKTTAKKSFSITKSMLEKIDSAAVTCNQFPAIVVSFIDEITGKEYNSVAVIPIWAMDLLCQKP